MWNSDLYLKNIVMFRRYKIIPLQLPSNKKPSIGIKISVKFLFWYTKNRINLLLNVIEWFSCWFFFILNIIPILFIMYFKECLQMGKWKFLIYYFLKLFLLICRLTYWRSNTYIYGTRYPWVWSSVFKKKVNILQWCGL